MQRLFLFGFFSLLLLTGCSNPSGNDRGLPESPAERSAKKKGKIISGKVVGISDGDTFKLLVEGAQTLRVRLYGVDAPEKGQDFGTQAHQKLSALIFSKEVEVQQKDRDRYGRVVGIAFVEGCNVNKELLRTGYAWQYTDYDRSKAWGMLQQQAKEEKAGLWSQPNPTPPWQWRREKRQTKNRSGNPA